MSKREAPAEPEEPPADAEPEGEPAPGEEKGPEETKIRLAMVFYQEALRAGPRLSQEVIAEGVRRGHAKRTQSRARSRLRVKTIPPATWQGPWMMALPGDPAVEAAKQRREEKQERQGNGRKKRKWNEGGRKPGNELLAAIR